MLVSAATRTDSQLLSLFCVPNHDARLSSMAQLARPVLPVVLSAASMRSASLRMLSGGTGGAGASTGGGVGDGDGGGNGEADGGGAGGDGIDGGGHGDGGVGDADGGGSGDGDTATAYTFSSVSCSQLSSMCFTVTYS